MARPRKEGKRTKGGRLKNRVALPDASDPTPEFLARRESAQGREVSSPLSYMHFTDGQREALDTYFRARCAAGWGEVLPPASLAFEGDYDRAKDSKSLPLEPVGELLSDDERAQIAADRFNSADHALLVASPAAHKAVLTAFSFRSSGIRYAKTAALDLGANLLAAHYGIQRLTAPQG
jgi:hypothetical protein